MGNSPRVLQALEQFALCPPSLVARSATPSLFFSGASAAALPSNLLLLSRIGVDFWLKFGPWMR
jgi:hypothetical protein